LFAALGIDQAQWWALSRMLVRSDFRPPGPQTQQATTVLRNLALMFVVYGLMGAAASFIIVTNPDVLLSGTVVCAYIMMMVATAMLTQHGATLTATDDYAILGVRPVSARTFFAVRLTKIVFHALVITTMLSYLPLTAYAFAHGPSAARLAGAIVALYGCALTTTFALVAVYAGIVRVVGVARVTRVMSYVQMLVGFVAYGGFVVIMPILNSAVVTNATLPRGPWLLAVPPAWFAGLLDAIAGSGGAWTWPLAACAVLAIVATPALLIGRLSLDYAGALSALVTVQTAAATGRQRRRRAWLFTRDEARAVAILVTTQFRHDLKFRLGVLSIVPLTMLYFYLGARDGSLTDPFLRTGRASGLNFIAMAIVMFPMILLQHVTTSDAYRAAWIFFATPASKARLIVALKNVVLAYFLSPYLVLLTIILSWSYGHVGHALAEAACLAMVANLAIQVLILARPRLPFALPQAKTDHTAAMFGLTMALMISGTIVVAILELLILRTWTRVAIALLVMAAVSYALSRALPGRADTAELTTG
jgi:hypothetical protein